MTRPRALDLFCGAGGAAMGYHKAGFNMVGVDIEPQPHYPFEFIQADALEFLAEHGHEFDFIHASPPCQAYCRISGRSRKAQRRKYPDLVKPTRDALMVTGVPWVMENVEEAPLINPVCLCGSMFGLDVRRHRHFESSIVILAPPCDHSKQLPRFRTLDSRRAGKLACVIGVHGHLNYPGEFELRCAAMGIDWMTNEELTQAIPPAYTEFIGRQMMPYLEDRE